MKSKLMLLTTAAIFVGSLNANASGDGLGSCYSALDCIARCAPQIQTANIQAVDNVLTQIAQTSLKDVPKFVSLVREAKKLSEKDRLDAYMKLAGVKDDKDIVEFVGARAIDPRYVAALKESIDLSDEQAILVIQSISSTLLGQRK